MKKASGHDQPAPRHSQELCEVRERDPGKVTRMRASVATADPGDLNKVEAESRAIFGRLLAVAENYPDPMTSTTVTNLMVSVKGLEDEIARQRSTYNNISRELNTMMDTKPSNFVGRLTELPRLDTCSSGKRSQHPENRVLKRHGYGRNNTARRPDRRG